MSMPNAPPTSLPRVRMTFVDWSVSYKVALGVMLVGFLMVVWSPFIGEPFYERAVTPFIELLGAPEGWELLPAQEPQTGAEILVLLGGCNLAVGVCMFCVLLVLELLGLAGAPVLTRRMRPPGKLALGTAAAGLVVFTVGKLPEVLLSLLFVDYEHILAGTMGVLDVISQAGGLLMVCSPITLRLRSHRSALFHWTEVVGWGRVRRGWVNKLALALIAGGLISMFRFIMPFDDVADAFFVVGLTVLALGIVPELLAIGRP